MNVNLEKLESISVSRSEKAIFKAKQRRENRGWIRMSQEIALFVHEQLRMQGLTQKALAEQLSVSPSYVTKILNGNANLTLETVNNLQTALGVQILFFPKRETYTVV